MVTRRRNPNGRSSIYKGKDGYWHGWVSVGTKDDGRPDRRHVKRRKKAEVVDRVNDLEQQRAKGRVQEPGRWRVEDWLNHWLHNIAKPALRTRAWEAYDVAVRVDLTPGVGRHWLDRLQPEHLERLYVRMTASGSKPATAHQVHRTVKTALEVAVKRGYLTQNPAQLAKAPRVEDEDIEPFSVDEAQRILLAAGRHRNGARWALALALGLRQGEALGLKWEPHVDLDRAVIRIRKQRNRPRYAHGCGGDCGKTPGRCPARSQIVPDDGPTKSKASRRTVGIPSSLVVLLRAHKEAQEQEREAARHLWHDEGWVFATLTGKAISPSTDYHAWKRLLKEAGVREARLHDARHTAATVLLVLGVTERAAMEAMGWSSSSMVRRYQHVTEKVRRDVAGRIDALLWEDQNRPDADLDGD